MRGLCDWRFFGPRHWPLLKKSSSPGEKKSQSLFPEKTDEEIETILDKMWDHLGRNIAEYPHLPRIQKAFKNYLTFNHPEHVQQALKENKGVILLSAHFGNWEMSTIVPIVCQLTAYCAYKPPKNPYLEFFLKQMRNARYGVEAVPVSAEGTKKMMRVLKEGKVLFILPDQKDKDGIDVSFMGRKTKMASGVAKFASHFKCPIVPLKSERIKGCNHQVTALKPFYAPQTGQGEKDIKETMIQMNQIIESWIKEKPEQWLWIYKMWD